MLANDRDLCYEVIPVYLVKHGFFHWLPCCQLLLHLVISFRIVDSFVYLDMCLVLVVLFITSSLILAFILIGAHAWEVLLVPRLQLLCISFEDNFNCRFLDLKLDLRCLDADQQDLRLDGFLNQLLNLRSHQIFAWYLFQFNISILDHNRVF